MGVTQKVSLNLDLKSTKDLRTQIENALKSKVKNDTDQKQGFLTTASTTSNNFTTIDGYIKNVTETKIEDKTVQELTQLLDNAQSGTFLARDIDCSNMKGDANIGNITQSIISTQVVDLLLKSIMGQTAFQDFKNSAASDASNSTKQDNSGFTGLVKAVLGPLLALLGGGIFAYAMIFICPCLVICFLCTMCMVGGKKGSSAPPTSAATAFGKKLKKALISLKKM